jgi:hypothetical protein
VNPTIEEELLSDAVGDVQFAFRQVPSNPGKSMAAAVGDDSAVRQAWRRPLAALDADAQARHERCDAELYAADQARLLQGPGPRRAGATCIHHD